MDYILLKSGSISGLYFYLSKGVNTKDVTYLNVHYACMLHCMIKLRPDLESTHQASHFGIWFVQIRQIEADID